MVCTRNRRRVVDPPHYCGPTDHPPDRVASEWKVGAAKPEAAMGAQRAVHCKWYHNVVRKALRPAGALGSALGPGASSLVLAHLCASTGCFLRSPPSYNAPRTQCPNTRAPERPSGLRSSLFGPSVRSTRSLDPVRALCLHTSVQAPCEPWCLRHQLLPPCAAHQCAPRFFATPALVRPLDTPVWWVLRSPNPVRAPTART